MYPDLRRSDAFSLYVGESVWWNTEKRKWEVGELWWLEESKWADVKRSEPLPASSVCVCVTHCRWISDEVSRFALWLTGGAILPNCAWHLPKTEANLEMMDAATSAFLCLEEGKWDLVPRGGEPSWQADWIFVNWELGDNGGLCNCRGESSWSLPIRLLELFMFEGELQ